MASIKKIPLTIERLKECLSYDPVTGNFRWLVSSGVYSRPAGSTTSNGYWKIRIDGGDYLAHRLAWFYVTGEWPQHFLDHKDRNGHNNAWVNLRKADTSQNKINCVGWKKKILPRGVFLIKRPYRLSNPYRAAIEVSGKYVGLGYFDNPQDASAAYEAAAIKIHGEFAEEVAF